MDAVLGALAVFLALNIAVGSVVVLRATTPAGQLLPALLFGTTGVATLLVLAQLQGSQALRDVAFVFVALAALVVLVFARTTRSGDDPA